jgi:hypothetical protein
VHLQLIVVGGQSGEGEKGEEREESHAR